MVCVRNASFSGSSTSRASTAAIESTTKVRSGASPEVPNDFLVILVADENNGALFASKLQSLQMHLGH